MTTKWFNIPVTFVVEGETLEDAGRALEQFLPRTDELTRTAFGFDRVGNEEAHHPVDSWYIPLNPTADDGEPWMGDTTLIPARVIARRDAEEALELLEMKDSVRERDDEEEGT